MQTAKLFKNGNSQAVRLPKGFRFEGTEVYISKKKDCVILKPKVKTWKEFFKTALPMSEDFMNERLDFFQPEREEL